MTDVFTAAELAAISKPSARTKTLVEIVAVAPPATVGYTWRFCTGRHERYGGYKYTSRPVEISGIGRGGAQSARMTIKISNHDAALGKDMKAAVRNVGSTCKVILLTEQPGGVYGDPVVLIDGRVVRISGGHDISIEASPLYGQRREPSLMKGSRNCGNAYSTTGIKLCQYAGGLAGCLRTQADCIAHHGDLEFFNGFPNAPNPGDSLELGDSKVKVSSSSTEYYWKRSEWRDKDSALGDVVTRPDQASIPGAPDVTTLPDSASLPTGTTRRDPRQRGGGR